jgi:hypothetical protein
MSLGESLDGKSRRWRLFFYRPRVEVLESRTLPSFVSAVGYSTGLFPDGVAVGESPMNHIYLGNGNGTFHAGATYGFEHPASVLVGDFNGDNAPDLAVCDTNHSALGVLLGNGNGTCLRKVDWKGLPGCQEFIKPSGL